MVYGYCYIRDYGLISSAAGGICCANVFGFWLLVFDKGFWGAKLLFRVVGFWLFVFGKGNWVARVECFVICFLRGFVICFGNIMQGLLPAKLLDYPTY